MARNRQAEPGAYLRDLAGDLDWIVMRALEKEPDRRYTSASELAADVQRYLLNEPVIARPPGTSYRIGKFIRRHRVGAALTGVIILSLIGGIVGTTFALVRARRAEADARAAEGVAKNENESFEKVTRELAEMFKDADPRRTGRNITARELLDIRARAIDESLGDEPRAAGRIMLAMARAYRSIGAYPEAGSMFEKALPLLEHAYGREHESVFDALNEMGILSSELLDLEGAEKHQREALQIAEALRGPEHVDVATVLKNLADTLIKLDRPSEAEVYLSRSTEIRTKAFGAGDIIVAKNLSTLSSLLVRAGDVQRAVEVARRSLESRTTYWKAEPDHPDIGFGHYYVGEAQSAAGLNEAAIESFRTARDLWERAYGPSHPNVGECSFRIAERLHALGKNDEAYEALRSARASIEVALGVDEPSTAESLAVWMERFSEFLTSLGRPAEALHLAEEAAALRAKVRAR